MPEEDALGQEDALLALGSAIVERWPGAEPLSDEVLIRRFPKRALAAGWRLPVAPIDEHILLLIIPWAYPYTLPLVALAEKPHPATLPHVEEDGVLCLVPSGSLMELPADIRHVDEIFADAVKVLQEGVDGSNRQDFLDEVSTYWCLGQAATKSFWVTLSDSKTSRRIRATDLGSSILLAENDAGLQTWLTNCENPKHVGKTEPAGFIHLPFPVYPEDYPHRSGDLVALAARAGQEAINVLQNLLEPGRTSHIVFMFEHTGLPYLLGASVTVGTTLDGGRRGLPLWHGYRKGKVPKDEMLSRIANAGFAVSRSEAVRVDSTALLRRTAGTGSDALKNVSVAVIGCGALGGPVTQLLAQAGVRRLSLIDGDQFKWQNVGRHILPGSCAGQNKAKALRRHVLDRFPEYAVEAIGSRWQEAWKNNRELFTKHDLVISLAADWTSEYLLNKLCKEEADFPGVIFGWVEAHALAGHALTVLPKGGCLRCLCDEAGMFLKSVATVSPDKALQREHSCGTFYQPFSAAAAMPAAALVTKAALDALLGRVGQSEHRVWVGAKEDFDVVDARIRSSWVDKLHAEGWERVFRLLLPAVDDCPICKGGI